MTSINDDLGIPGDNPAEVEETKVTKGTKAAKKQVDPLEKEVEVTLHATDEVPPGGQYVSVNGVGINIPVGRRCKIKQKYLNVLRDANTRIPVMDDNTMQVVGYRERMRFSIEVHN